MYEVDVSLGWVQMIKFINLFIYIFLYLFDVLHPINDLKPCFFAVLPCV